MGARLGLTLALAAALGLAACGPEPTPLPVVPVATTPAPTPTVAARLRYALDEAAAAALGPLVDRLRQYGEVAIGPLPTPPTSDIQLSTTPLDGGAALPALYPLAITLDAAQPPLDQPAVAEAVTRALQAAASNTATDAEARAVRAALANAGLPDGARLRIDGPLAQGPALAAYGVLLTEARTAPHLRLVYGDAGPPGSISGFRIPIYIWTAPALPLTVDDAGLPRPAG